MLPARDRLTKLYVYSTEADMLADTNGTEFTSGVTDGSQHLQHIFFNSFPSFGEANAAMYECAISGTGDLTGKYIRVKYCYYATDAATTRTEEWLFAGKVYDCKYDKYKTERNLVAYDKLYELRTVDVSAWWTTYWAAQTGNRTYAQLVVDMCTEFGVEYEWVNLSDAGAVIKKDAAQNLKLSGVTFTTMLGYVGQLSRYSWFIRANGKLGRTYMHNNITQTSVDSNMDASETEISDEALPAYTGVTVYDGADVIYSWGSGNPTWAIRDNPLLKGKTTSEITTEIDALRPKLAVTAGYYPIELECMVSSPDVLNIGYDNLINIKTTDGNNVRKHVIGAIDLYGAQLINQHVTCPSEMQSGSGLTAAQAATISALQQMGVALTYKVNADNVIEAVNLEAQGGVQINAEAININGVVSANNGFKINLDGSMEATAGKFSGKVVSEEGTIGGLNLAANKLYKTNSFNPDRVAYADGIEVRGGDEPAIEIGGRTGRLIGNAENEVISMFADRWGLNIAYGTDYRASDGLYHINIDDSFYGNTLINGRMISIVGRTGSGETYIDNENLRVNDRDILHTHQSLVGGWGTAIPANANLNTDDYCEVGRFYVGADATAATHTNCPTRYAYMMDVFAPISSDYENTSYIVREIRTRYGDKYVQYVTGSTTKTYSKWVMQLSSASDNKVFADQLTSRNIANNSSIRNGSFDGQGQETSSTTRIRTGYIGVLPNTQYGIRTNYSTLQIYEIHEYTSSQAFIKYTSVNSSSVIFKTSSTTGYFRILMRYSDNRTLTPDEGAKLQIERGEQLSSYTPYEATDMEVTVPPYTYTDLGTASTHSAFFQAWLKRIAVNFDSWGAKVLKGRVTPNESGVVYGMMYGGVTSDGLPRYSGFTYVSAGILKYFGTNNGTFYLRSVNYTSEV